jgi:glyoxylase-like metal-dependent hydrolase (beta-lactamase superfamily II)
MIQVQQHGSVTAIRMARTFLGRPLYWTTAYWLDGLLIDSGPPCLAEALVRVLQPLAVEQIVLTHAHEDHIGGLYQLRQRYPDARIYASPLSIPLIQEPQRLHPHLYRRLLWGVPKAVAAVDPLPLLVETPQFKLRVVETPGHSQDHVSFFEARHRWLFTGDAFIGGKDRSWASDYEMFGVISSLRTLGALRPERLFPGSGNIRRTALPEIHGKIGQLLELCQNVARLDTQGVPTDEIVRRLLGGETRMRFWTQGHFSGVNLIQACRRYNEIFNPTNESDAAQPTTSSHQRGQTTDSSTSESADQSDWRSTM